MRILRYGVRMREPVPFIAAVCVGQPRFVAAVPDLGKHGTAWTSGIFKAPVEAAVATAPYGLSGDAQADLHNHGGPDKAICAYSADHYEDWRQRFGLDHLEFGAFGENLSLAGVDEHHICIGDRWATGDVLIQVSQPRQPCWKLERKWHRDTLINEVIASGRTGWYFRVERGGTLQRGMELVLVERPHPQWTIAAANNVWHHRIGDAAALARAQELSESWRRALERRIAYVDPDDLA